MRHFKSNAISIRLDCKRFFLLNVFLVLKYSSSILFFPTMEFTEASRFHAILLLFLFQLNKYMCIWTCIVCCSWCGGAKRNCAGHILTQGLIYTCVVYSILFSPFFSFCKIRINLTQEKREKREWEKEMAACYSEHWFPPFDQILFIYLRRTKQTNNYYSFLFTAWFQCFHLFPCVFVAEAFALFH